MGGGVAEQFQGGYADHSHKKCFYSKAVLDVFYLTHLEYIKVLEVL